MKPAIDICDLTLVRRTQEELHYDFKRTVLNMLRGRGRAIKRRTVIERLDLRIERGEKIGIIGPNGSGKSTLLKLMAGVLKPTTGRLTVEGSLAPLIEIGVGFDPDLTLVDNIVYYGVLLGHDEDVVKKHVDAVLDFAELAGIRDQPTKTLSSGMNARLGFAVATEFRPEILLLDEVLSVGDERFRRKCGARIDRFWDAHSTIVLVSHDLGYVARTCDRVIWLEDGKVRYDGDPVDAVKRYLETVPDARSFRTGEELVALAASRENGELVIRGSSWGSEGARIFLIREGHRRQLSLDEWYARNNGIFTEDIIDVDDVIIMEIPELEAARP